MAILDRIFPLTTMGLILAFSLIHLGVSLGIIIPYRKYGDIFRPEIGLAAFNIVISFFGLLAGILGLICILKNSDRFGKIVCIVFCTVGVFALASLVTAIIINAKSLNYVSSHFLSNMNGYSTNQDSRNKIDQLQIKYQCCGVNIWLDWANVGLVATTPGTNVTSNTTTTVQTTGSSTTTISSSTSTSTTATSNGRIAKRDVLHISNNLHHQQSLPLAQSSRQKRQVIATYGGINGLPISFGAILPTSCCTSGALLTSNTSNAYCISNANNAVNHFNTAGCAQPLDIVAGNQAMGLGVINSFMVVLAFIATPIMLQIPSTSV